jgi:formate transporter
MAARLSHPVENKGGAVIHVDKGVPVLQRFGTCEMGAPFFLWLRSHFKGSPMAYLAPVEFVTKMVDAAESKLLMSTRDTLIRAFMAGAILALGAAFAVSITVNTGNALLGALLFPVGFIMLYLLGFDLLTGAFTLAPLAVFDKRPGATWLGVLRNWGLVFTGNFAGALMVAVFMAIVFTFGFSEAPNAIGVKIGHIGESRTVGYAAHGAAGMLTLFIRGVM